MQQKIFAINCVFEEPVLRPANHWCRFGIRDPSILSSTYGTPILKDGMITVYFNGRNRPIGDGGKTRIGRARLTQDLKKAHVDNNFVFEHEDYAAQGSVIRLSRSSYWMFYSHGTDLGFMHASSTDGLIWQRHNKVLLTPEQFGCSRIGLPFVIRHGSKWLMVFEGIFKRTFHIFAAVSIDGLIWQPACDGRPIYTPHPKAWDIGGQANPSLVIMDSDLANGSKWFMFYNGHARKELSGWDIGVLITDDPLSGHWTGGDEPLLRRSVLSWCAGRLEGARLLQMQGQSQDRMLFFGLPGPNSYKKGAIGNAEININKMDLIKKDKPNVAEVDANNELAQRYFKIWDTFPIQKFTRIVENKWINELVQSGQSVLLAGSGGGREIEALLGKTSRIVAMDISPEMLRIGRERYPQDFIEWRLGDVHSPPKDIGKFDHVLALGGVFAYLADPKQAARALGGTLNALGSLTICVMNAAHPTEGQGRKKLEKGRVRQAFLTKEVFELMEEANLTVDIVRGFRFFVDNLPPEWNKTSQANKEIDEILRNAIDLEMKLLDHMNADKGKFIWVTGCRQQFK